MILKVNMYGQTPGFEWAEGVDRENSPNRSAILLKNGVALKMTGKGDGGLAEANTIPANSVVKISFGHCTPRRRDVRMFVNPELLEKAGVSHAGTFHGDTGRHEIAIYIHSYKQVDLDKFSWLAGVQVVE